MSVISGVRPRSRRLLAWPWPLALFLLCALIAAVCGCGRPGRR